MKNRPRYVLITPARNEEDTIELVIQSVISQTEKPERWILVSDNSTDGTDLIMKRYAQEYDFITYLRKDDARGSGFGSKARAFMLACASLQDEEYAYIGNLDADITMRDDYFECLLDILEKDRSLGIGGGEIMEMRGGRFLSRDSNVNSVAGAVQMFRRECFENVGGYMPTRYGGIDTVAETLARMRGWQVRTFPELEALHHRRVGVTSTNIIRSRFRYGIRDNHLGGHPLFIVVKCLSKSKDSPMLIGSLAWIAGYYYSILRGDKRPVSIDFIRFIRSQQVERMNGYLRLRKVQL